MSIYRELYFALESEKAMKAKIARLKRQVKDSHVLGEHDVEGYRVKITNVMTERFQTKDFKADHPDLHDEYLKCSESTRLTIKPIAV